MKYIYNIAIFLYALIVRFYSLFNEKAAQFVSGRKKWRIRLKNALDKNARYIWVHCASLGEFEQGRPVIEEIKSKHPEFKVILTFFSPSGYEVRKNYELADIVVYLPIDTKKNAKDFIGMIQPEKVFFVKYEFWYHYITCLHQQKIPLFIISGIFRSDQHFFKNWVWSKWFRKILFKIEHFFVQNETSGLLLKQIGLKNFSISGDTRFDRVAAIASHAKKIPIVEKFKGKYPLVIAGSTWKQDEELLVSFINNSNGIKFIIAPHEVSSSNINRIKQLLKKPAVLFSQIENEEIETKLVLIIDSIGLLSSVYRYGSIAYIGGGFGVGIHNILEAATFGLPVIFGPKFKKFKEAVDLVSLKGAFTIQNINELNTVFNSLLTENTMLKNAARICENYVKKNVGSTKIIVKKVFNT